MQDSFRSLPAYFGSKRSLVQVILALLNTVIPQAEWPQLVFVDPFLGGGSVSLTAKAAGFEVKCNDVALRSAAIGHALIANGCTKLSLPDLATLLGGPAAVEPGSAERRYSPAVFPQAHARVLDRVLANLHLLEEPERSLATVLIVKWVLRIQPMSQLRGTDARAAAEGDLNRVSSRRLGHYLKAGRLLHLEAWQALLEDVNAGVFPGKGEAHQLDVYEFLARTRGDVVYLDPPYPGTTSYEKEYAALDDLLEGKQRQVSSFSRSADELARLFAACDHIRVWLISLNNAVMDLEQLRRLVQSFRPRTRALEIPYRHLGSIASEDKNERNREFVIIASA